MRDSRGEGNHFLTGVWSKSGRFFACFFGSQRGSSYSPGVDRALVFYSNPPRRGVPVSASVDFVHSPASSPRRGVVRNTRKNKSCRAAIEQADGADRRCDDD